MIPETLFNIVNNTCINNYYWHFHNSYNIV